MAERARDHPGASFIGALTTLMKVSLSLIPSSLGVRIPQMDSGETQTFRPQYTFTM